LARAVRLRSGNSTWTCASATGNRPARIFLSDPPNPPDRKPGSVLPGLPGVSVTVHILSGLEAGQRVATSNLGPLYDTAPVTTASARSAEAATH
jgi:hypothetical protein